MNLAELRYVCCISCGSTTGPLRNLPCLAQGLKACERCLAKHGAEALAREADRAVAEADPPRYIPPPVCLHCGTPMLVNPDGASHPAWCAKCEAERRALMGAS